MIGQINDLLLVRSRPAIISVLSSADVGVIISNFIIILWYAYHSTTILFGMCFSFDFFLFFNVFLSHNSVCIMA